MIRVRAMCPEDWPAVRRIHAAGIDTGHATFAESPASSMEEFSSGKIAGLSFVAIATSEDAGPARVLGWTAASRTSPREAYRGVVEDSVYVEPAARGRGVADALLATLVEEAERQDVWTLQCSIFPENTASLRLHVKHGFRVVGQRSRIALMTYGPRAGTWRDTVLLERRSARV